jgi:hypothetical protein
LHWEEDHANLARILVKARVTDLEAIPKLIIFSEPEGFAGQSWTIQCEIIHENLLGAQPTYEDDAPLDDRMEHNPPFDFFGLGQPANQGQFHQEQMAHPEVEQPEAQNWGQWLAGDAHAAPAAQVANMQDMLNNNALDMNVPVEDDT